MFPNKINYLSLLAFAFFVIFFLAPSAQAAYPKLASNYMRTLNKDKPVKISYSGIYEHKENGDPIADTQINIGFVDAAQELCFRLQVEEIYLGFSRLGLPPDVLKKKIKSVLLGAIIFDFHDYRKADVPPPFGRWVQEIPRAGRLRHMSVHLYLGQDREGNLLCSLVSKDLIHHQIAGYFDYMRDWRQKPEMIPYSTALLDYDNMLPPFLNPTEFYHTHTPPDPDQEINDVSSTVVLKPKDVVNMSEAANSQKIPKPQGILKRRGRPHGRDLLFLRFNETLESFPLEGDEALDLRQSLSPSKSELIEF